MNLKNLKVEITLKGFERGDTAFKTVFKPGVLEKIAIDFSSKRVRGTCMRAYK